MTYTLVETSEDAACVLPRYLSSEDARRNVSTNEFRTTFTNLEACLC
ncbi:hypothetical protein ACFQO4_16625 [Saliphagus sp. GCM10025334]